LAAAKAAIVERKMELGRQLAALRETVSDNRRFGTGVRRQFDIHNATEAGEMARVARLYGSRPEIYTAVGWNALAQLSSPSTPESVRLQIEEMIVAGERVTGTEVIRARLDRTMEQGRLLERRPQPGGV
jgi:Arc/MetJ-type ribon-helix-helix transcriptional regulator